MRLLMKQIETHLATLGVIGYSGSTFRTLPANQITSITQQLYTNLIEASGDNTLTSEQTKAINALQSLVNEENQQNNISRTIGGQEHNFVKVDDDLNGY